MEGWESKQTAVKYASRRERGSTITNYGDAAVTLPADYAVNVS